MGAMATRTVAISSKELESAIEVLSSAGRAFQLTRFERISYNALMVCVDAFIVSLVVVIIAFILAFTLGGEKSTSAPLEMLAGVVISVGFLVGIVCLALNVPLLRKVLRERAKLKELGLSSLSKQLWKQSRRRRWISRVRSVVLIVLSIYFIAVGLALGPFWVSFIPQYKLEGERLRQLELEAQKQLSIETGAASPTETGFASSTEHGLVLMLFGILMVLSSVLFAGLLLAARYLRNQRERMDLAASAEELKKALQSLQQRKGAEIISVPAELLEKTAKIESAQIAKERKDAVLESVTSPPTGYAIAFDRDAADQRATLDIADRVALQDLVEELSSDGTPAKPQVGTGQGRTKNNRVEIDYVIDKASHAIRVISVRHIGEVSHATVNGDRHA